VKDRDLRYIPSRASYYWVLVRRKAKELGSDGCTGVADFYLDACYEHDIHWRTSHTLTGYPISTRQANMRFRWVIQDRSPFGKLSPMSWWRWIGVTIGGIIHDAKAIVTAFLPF
jgi:hypothetical protein